MSVTLARERQVTTTEVVPPVASRPAIAVGLLGTVAAYLALGVCAASATPIGLVVAAAAVAGTEVLLARRVAIVTWALHRIGFGPVARGLVRAALLLLFAARTTSTALTIGTAAAALVIAGAEAWWRGVAEVVTFLRLAPVLCRGLPVEIAGIPAAPKPLLLEPGGLAAVVQLPAALGLALSANGSTLAGFVGLLLSTLLAIYPPAVLAAHALTLRRTGVRRRLTDEVQRRLVELGPEVAIYLGGVSDWRYQVEMWLETVEDLGRPAVVIVRDVKALEVLAATSLPVLGIPRGGDLMRLELPSLRVVLYVSNTADNIHMLRRRGVNSVFIGHGDSDKTASFNPYSRVYDEIWVAGDAGRDRYLNGGVPVAPEAIVEVGRPQLGELPRADDSVPKLTVLYAPTWEGWGDDPFHTSLHQIGPDLIHELLSRPGVRVMYRPHPLSGSRDVRLRGAHDEIVRLMRAAGAGSPAVRARPSMRNIAPPAGGGLLDIALAGRLPWLRAEQDRLIDRWTDAYWAARPGHRILVPPAPDLYACFARADALIADVSGVTTDFLAADRPYAVVNLTGETSEEFRQRAPSASAGFVLGPDLAELDDLLTAAAHGPDPMASARQEARAYLLGPRTPDPAETFRRQVNRLCRTSRQDGDPGRPSSSSHL